MKGLIIKDFLYMKPQAKILIALLLFYVFLFIPNGNSILIAMMMVILCVITITNCTALDESSKWDRYACTLPISRKNIVLSRYFALVILATFGFLITTTIGVVGNMFFKKMSFPDVIVANIIFYIFSFLAIAVMLPITYKFGPNKTRIIMFGIIVLPSVFIPFLAEFINKNRIDLPTLAFNFPTELIVPIVLLLVAASMFLSYVISVKIYLKKDF